MTNTALARTLLTFARSLEQSGVNLFRARAYRVAAESILRCDRSLSEIVAEGGRSALQKLPGIGRHIAYTLAELIRTGRFHTWRDRRTSSRLSL
jgi:DNA polymerase (family 10)